MTEVEFLREVIDAMGALMRGELTLKQYATRLAIISLVAEGNDEPSAEQVHALAAEFLASATPKTINRVRAWHDHPRRREMASE